MIGLSLAQYWRAFGILRGGLGVWTPPLGTPLSEVKDGEDTYLVGSDRKRCYR